MKFYETGFLILVNQATGMILNNPFNSSSTYAIFDTSITGLTLSDWNQIKDSSTAEEYKILTFTNSNKEDVLIMRNFI